MRINTPRDHYFEKKSWHGYFVHGFLSQGKMGARWHYAVLNPDEKMIVVYSRKSAAIARIEALLLEQNGSHASREEL